MAIPSKFIEEPPYAKPGAAAAKLIEIALTLRVDKGRMCVGEWNDKFRAAGGSVDEYAGGRDKPIADGIIRMHECGALFFFTAEGSARFPRPD